MKKKQFNAWTIYLWRNGDKMEGAAGVMTRDGLKDIYCHGWEIEKVPDARRNEDRHQAKRAEWKVKKLLNNTLNVINWYGKKVLDRKGNIDTEKLKILEIQMGMRAAKQSEENMHLNLKNKDNKDWKKLDENLDINDLYEIKKFPVKNITIQEAHDYGLKGESIQRRISK